MGICSNVYNAVEGRVLEYGTQDIQIRSEDGTTEIRVRLTPVRAEVNNQTKKKELAVSGANDDAYKDGVNYVRLPEYLFVSYYIQVNGSVIANRRGPDISTTEWPKDEASRGLLTDIRIYMAGGDAEEIEIGDEVLLNDRRSVSDLRRAYYNWVLYLRKTVHVIQGYSEQANFDWSWLLDQVQKGDAAQVLGTPSAGIGLNKIKGSELEDYFKIGKPFTLGQFQRGCIEHSFIKTIGDFSQVLTCVTANGGYIDGPYYAVQDQSKMKTKSSPELTVVRPKPDSTRSALPVNDGRIGIHNDQPAAAVGMFLTLYGQNWTGPPGMSENTMTLYRVGEKPGGDEIITKGVYGAYRGFALPPAGGARRKRRTRRANKKKRYTKRKNRHSKRKYAATTRHRRAKPKKSRSKRWKVSTRSRSKK